MSKSIFGERKVQKLIKEAWLTTAQGRVLKIGMQGETRIGRGSENDVVLEDSTVSKQHALISFDNGRAFLRDLGSSNGTFVSGELVSGSPIADGAVIRLGCLEIVYRETFEALAGGPLQRCSSCGERIGLGSLFCAQCGTRLVSALAEPTLFSAITGNVTQSRPRLFSVRTGAILFGLFLLGLSGTLAHLELSSSSTHPVARNLAAIEGFRLPDASSDFIGEWCGWSHVASCDPPGRCNEDSMPISLNFDNETGWLNNHSVMLHYTILTPPSIQIQNIQVRALDPHHVEVKYVAKPDDDSSASDYDINTREDIVSISPAIVLYTDHLVISRGGTEQSREEVTAQLSKCSADFRTAEQDYMERNNLVENGKVSGQVPSQ